MKEVLPFEPSLASYVFLSLLPVFADADAVAALPLEDVKKLRISMMLK